ncbi:hypothetical protein AAULR_17709 [Lacticaseibacillus rhamnosus MTCC 5462]|nr:hypothetical protein AAULR_17709 [Lacticaseibacillus rhamnosus MTCC 5462]
MTHLNRPCTGNKLIMPRLENIALVITPLLATKP